MKIFTYIKNDSSRIPKKNFQKIGELPLWKHLIYELRNEHVYIDTDSEEILQECENLEHVTCYKRLNEHIQLENDSVFKVSPALLMIDRFLDERVSDDQEIIVNSHVTSPFIKLDTILNAVNKLQEGYDSVQACTNHYEFAYFKNKPVNFDPNVIQKTQDLEPVSLGNGAFFIFTKELFKKHNNRTGNNPYFYPLGFREGIEIDTIEDYELAKRYV